MEISTADTLAVLGSLTGPLAELPNRLRFRLVGRIRDKLRAGWYPAQISDILAAPMPANVAAPYSLALWRLAQNMPGAGPRLTRLQQAWDAEQNRAEQQRTETTTARWYADVLAATTDAERRNILTATTVKFGRATESPVAALAGAGRRAARLYPGLLLADALRRWASEVLSDRPADAGVDAVDKPADAGLLIELAIGDRCVVCDQHHGTPRPQLPLMSTVCDRCWPVIAAELAGDGGAGAAMAARLSMAWRVR